MRILLDLNNGGCGSPVGSVMGLRECADARKLSYGAGWRVSDSVKSGICRHHLVWIGQGTKPNGETLEDLARMPGGRPLQSREHRFFCCAVTMFAVDLAPRG
jgi:hypothetical protein